MAAAAVAPVVAPALPPESNGVILVPQSGVSLSPTQVVAPVGSEVVMIASVFDPRDMPWPANGWNG